MWYENGGDDADLLANGPSAAYPKSLWLGLVAEPVERM